MKAVVVGAGIAGLFAARHLVDLGVDVLLLADGLGATASGAGIASAQFTDRRLAAYARRSLALLAASVPVERCGMAQIALSEREAARLEGLRGVRRALPRALAAAFSPAFRRRVVAATFSDDDLWLDLRALRRVLVRGVPRLGLRVRAVEPGVVRTERGAVRADRIVVATGVHRVAGAPGPAPAFSIRLSKTVHVAANLPAAFHVMDTGLYARPDGAGRSIAGDGDAAWDASLRPPQRADGAFARRIESELREVLRRAGRVTPARAGAIAMTHDRRPVLRVRDGVALLAGFGGDGLVLAPAFAEEAAHRLLA